MTARVRRFPDLVVLDADNTLYDWVASFSRPLRATLFELHNLTGLPLAVLSGRLKEIFAQHGSVEYLQYLEDGSLDDLPGYSDGPSASIKTIQRTRHKEELRPYVGVRPGLARLRSAGIKVACFSDATRLHLLSRLHALGLLEYIDSIYCINESFLAHPPPCGDDLLKKVSGLQPNLRISVMPEGLRKPAKEALEYVLLSERCMPHEAAMLGDNLRKDVVMAKEAGVYDCWARYGASLTKADASLLVEVTHWARTDVKRYFQPSPTEIASPPTVTIDDFRDFVDLVVSGWTSRPNQLRLPVKPQKWSQPPLDEDPLRMYGIPL